MDAYVGLLWIIVRDYRLAEGDASDVVQTTWLRLVENIDRLSDPSRVGAWLTTTARRECLRVLRQSQRTVLLRDWEDMDRVDESGQEPDAELLRAERRTVVRGALAELSPSSQALLELLMSDPPLSYEDISSTLGVPVGSIGPTRGRSLRKLQTLVMARGLSEPA